MKLIDTFLKRNDTSETFYGSDAIKDNFPVSGESYAIAAVATPCALEGLANYIGKELTRWIDVKARVVEILKNIEKEKEKKEGE